MAKFLNTTSYSIDSYYSNIVGAFLILFQTNIFQIISKNQGIKPRPPSYLNDFAAIKAEVQAF